MQKLQLFTLTESSLWDIIVRSFTSYDVYYLSGYVRAFQLHGDGMPLLFYYEDEALRGINVVMRRDISYDPHFTGQLPENTYFDFATPYGYGGWLIEGDGDPAFLFTAYEDWCFGHNIISEFVRFHPVLANHTIVQDYYEIIPLGCTIAMELSSPKFIWENLTSQNRNKIRKAQKSGVEIFNGRSPALNETFRALYNATMDKDNANPYYYFSPAFYDSVLYDLPQNAQLFYAEKEGEIIAASLLLAANGRLNYHLSGSKRKFQSLAPTNLLLYEAALWGSANGCQTLHLGGGVGSSEDSLFAFKKAFYRGDPCRYHIGKKIFSQEVYETLVSQRVDLPETGFFPRYRACIK